MPVATTDIIIPQGASLTYQPTGAASATTILNPTNISGLSQTLADIVVAGVTLTAEIKVPGKKSFSDITVTATYIETEFAAIQTVMNARTLTSLVLTTSGSLASTPLVTTATFSGYFKGLTIPTIADNNEPLTYEFVFMVNSVTIT
jgi:hypothetical protein